MRTRRLTAFSIVLVAGAVLTSAQTPAADVLRLDPALDRIVARDARVEILKADYFGFTEGPLWLREDGPGGALLFSDVAANVVYKWTPDGRLSVFLERSGFSGDTPAALGFQNYLGFNGRLNVATIGSNGLARDPQGRLLIAAHGDRAIVRIDAGGTRTVVAGSYNGRRLNRPNDLVAKRNGTVYFTDPRPDSPAVEQPIAGVYRVKDGAVTLLLDDFTTPNGLALSADERYLFVNDSRRRLIMRYEVQADDTVANGRLFVDMSSDATPGNPDGMKVDGQGNVYSTGPGGIWILSSDGKHLGTIRLPELPTNMAFGDADGRTLYITDRRTLARIRLTGASKPAPPTVVVNAPAPAARPVVRLDPALDAIVSPDARLDVVKGDYFGLTEGPLWIRDGASGALIFSDISANAVYRWTPDNQLSVFLDKSGYSGELAAAGRAGYFGQSGRLWIANTGSNGITIDGQGRVVLAAQGDRSIVRIERNGSRTTLADRFDGKRLNRPNDVVVKSDGAVYFTDPFPMNNPAIELQQSGIYRIRDGRVEMLEKDVPVNGLAFSPDEKKFYISAGGQLNEYDVRPDGTIANRRLFVDFTVDKTPGNPDGMKVDQKGNLYSTGPGGIWIISADGRHLGTIRTPETATNMAFGGEDGRTLFITGRQTLFRIRLNAPGILPGAKVPAS